MKEPQSRAFEAGPPPTSRNNLYDEDPGPRRAQVGGVELGAAARIHKSGSLDGRLGRQAEESRPDGWRSQSVRATVEVQIGGGLRSSKVVGGFPMRRRARCVIARKRSTPRDFLEKSGRRLPGKKFRVGLDPPRTAKIVTKGLGLKQARRSPPIRRQVCTICAWAKSHLHDIDRDGHALQGPISSA